MKGKSGPVLGGGVLAEKFRAWSPVLRAQPVRMKRNFYDDLTIDKSSVAEW